MNLTIDASKLMPFSSIDLTEKYGRFNSYIIEGDVPQGVEITANGNLYITSNISDKVRLSTTGSLHTGGVIGDHVGFHASDISGKSAGSNGNFEATHGDIVLMDLGHHNHLKASGNIDLGHAENYFHATAGEEIYFKNIGDHGVLKAPYVRGKYAGNHSIITATEDNVVLDSIGDYSQVFCNCPTNIASQGKGLIIKPYIAPLRRTTSVNSRSPQGCGIFYDTVNNQHVLTKGTFDHGGEANVTQLIEAFGKLGVTAHTGQLVNGKGNLVEETYLPRPKSNKDQQKARKLVADFVSAHKQIGE